MTSPSDHQQYVDCIRDLARLSANSSLHSDDYMQTAELQIIALNLMLKSRKEGITAEDLVRSYTSEIENAAANIEIGTVMTNFSDLLCDKMRVFDQDTEANVCDDVQMLEATNKSSHPYGVKLFKNDSVQDHTISDARYTREDGEVVCIDQVYAISKE